MQAWLGEGGTNAGSSLPEAGVRYNGARVDKTRGAWDEEGRLSTRTPALEYREGQKLDFTDAKFVDTIARRAAGVHWACSSPPHPPRRCIQR